MIDIKTSHHKCRSGYIGGLPVVTNSEIKKGGVVVKLEGLDII